MQESLQAAISFPIVWLEYESRCAAQCRIATFTFRWITYINGLPSRELAFLLSV